VFNASPQLIPASRTVGFKTLRKEEGDNADPFPAQSFPPLDICFFQHPRHNRQTMVGFREWVFPPSLTTETPSKNLSPLPLFQTIFWKVRALDPSFTSTLWLTVSATRSCGASLSEHRNCRAESRETEPGPLTFLHCPTCSLFLGLAQTPSVCEASDQKSTFFFRKPFQISGQAYSLGDGLRGTLRNRSPGLLSAFSDRQVRPIGRHRGYAVPQHLRERLLQAKREF